MSLGPHEIERLVDEVMPGRGIDISLFCAACGYNLRGLPYRGICPECGHAYNARGWKMEGIFLPHQIEFPLSDIVAAALSAGMTVILLLTGWYPVGLLFAVMTVLFARGSYLKLARFIHFARLFRSIERDERDE